MSSPVDPLSVVTVSDLVQSPGDKSDLEDVTKECDFDKTASSPYRPSTEQISKVNLPRRRCQK